MDYSKLFNCNKKKEDGDDKDDKNETEPSLDVNKLGADIEVKNTISNEISNKRNQSTRQGGNRKGKYIHSLLTICVDGEPKMGKNG